MLATSSVDDDKQHVDVDGTTTEQPCEACTGTYNEQNVYTKSI